MAGLLPILHLVHTLQYTYLLTSQLESQRLFFEEKLARVEKEATDQVTPPPSPLPPPTGTDLPSLLDHQIAIVETRCRAAVSVREHLEEKSLDLEKEKKAADRKIQQARSHTHTHCAVAMGAIMAAHLTLVTQWE